MITCNSPVEFHQKRGQPRKNYYKDMLYIVGKLIISSLKWVIGIFFYFGEKKL